MAPRYAIYTAPPANSPLHAWAARWLGHDPETGARHAAEPAAGLSAASLAALTDEPRRYGLHGTLKPPFWLAAGCAEAQLIAALEHYAADRPPVSGPPLTVAALGRFIALRPNGPCPALDILAADCVRAFDRFRAPASEAELQRRRSAALTERQERYLQTWGYPYVMEEFRLHLTLTGPVADAAERAALLQHLTAVCAPFTAGDYRVDELCLFVQPEASAPFRIAGRYRLGG